jgi:hypothetical protein
MFPDTCCMRSPASRPCSARRVATPSVWSATLLNCSVQAAGSTLGLASIGFVCCSLACLAARRLRSRVRRATPRFFMTPHFPAIAGGQSLACDAVLLWGEEATLGQAMLGRG